MIRDREPAIDVESAPPGKATRVIGEVYHGQADATMATLCMAMAGRLGSKSIVCPH